MSDDLFVEKPEGDAPKTPDPEPVKPEGQEAPRTTEQFDQLLDSIKNEKGERKYGSVEDAIKALSASQEHIRRLEEENSEYRDKVTKASTMEDILQAITPKAEPEPPKQEPKGEAAKESVDIQALVGQAVQQIEAQKTAETNVNAVTSKLKELYGDKASETFYGKAEEVGLSKAEINSLATRSPSAVYKLLGIDTKARPKAEPAGVRTDGFQGQVDAPVKSAMGAATSEELLAAWQATKKKVNERLGIQQ